MHKGRGQKDKTQLCDGVEDELECEIMDLMARRR